MDLQISQPFPLSSGLVLPNRLVKSALGECLSKDGLPNMAHNNTYATWADGGWGLVMTGSVLTDERYLSDAGDVYLIDDEAKMREAWKAWAKASKGAAGGSPTMVQICHAGRQSPLGAGKRGFFEKSIAPSATPLQLGSGFLARLISALVFGTPREMTPDDIQDVVRRFARTARIAAEAGFDGVEIHAAHGFLLAQFLSAKVNKRTDAYGGSPAKRARIVVEIIRAVREAAPKGFTVGVKLNSVDHQSESELEDCIEQLQVILDEGIDFLEVSGGSFENPEVSREVQAKSARTKAREAFFLDFAKAIRGKFPTVPLLVTGGFRTRLGMEAAVAEGGCDLIGIGRPSVLNPLLPKTVVFNREVKGEEAKLFAKRIEAPWLMRKMISPNVGAGTEVAWYTKKISEMSNLGSHEI
ncbi:FMN-linked oxidoreductase [Cryphonectria parasitica EP155]|uniref:FMN-linked oxidoreductase n=1 Tax=Cryphonectria parasitica (strain ATCC 38755 / EP155) TaxID=660469 RepID=A0A9P5CTK8_CRYP1|nr:FMN-linked oxidoreductase [Cryphonectria parasitica EP155]KAF3769536.1 FMN-linked oxidoreductase [Cryphonectria parasitica EP155]